ncbi:MAG: phage capsid protein [Ruminococcus sp.]|nr:phage capsid protein [Ruminococcus sp.]
MQSAIDVWLDMYQYRESTANNDRSLDLPAAISSEFVRLVTAESELKIDGSRRADYLNEQLLKAYTYFVIFKAEAALALGSMAFKPYVSGDKILVDMVRADRYVPTAFDDSGEATAAVFMARKTVGKRYYTRLETHTWDADSKSYTVENRAYISYDDGTLGRETELASVPGWERLTASQTIANVEHPLFAVFRVPATNTVDLDSPLGVSVYAHAAELIRDANEQWARINWEYKGSELAIDASEDLFRKDKKTGKLRELPVGNKRLFRRHFSTDKNLSEDMQAFSPAIRDGSLFNGLNHILQRIEFNVGLAYGTLSEPSDTEKTATEILTSRQRSYVQVGKMQKSLESALDQLVYAMDIYTTLYELAPPGDYKLSCTWGDSVLEDVDKEFQRRLQLVTAGKLKPEKLLAWYFGVDEDKARSEYMPVDTELFGGSNAVTV